MIDQWWSWVVLNPDGTVEVLLDKDFREQFFYEAN